MGATIGTYADDFLRLRLSRPDIDAKAVSAQLNGSLLRLRELSESSQCTIGAVAELAVAIDLMNRGYAVFRALSHNSPCDLIAIPEDNRPLRIEVKTVMAGKTPTVDRKRFDHLALVVRKSGIVYQPSLPEPEDGFR